MSSQCLQTHTWKWRTEKEMQRAHTTCTCILFVSFVSFCVCVCGWWWHLSITDSTAVKHTTVIKGMKRRKRPRETKVERVLEIRKTRKHQKVSKEKRCAREDTRKEDERSLECEKMGWITFHVLKQRRMFHSHFRSNFRFFFEGKFT